MNALVQELMMSSCHYFTDDFKGNIHNAKLLSTINCPNIINVSLQESAHVSRINTTNKWNNTDIYTTSKWIIMTSSAERKNKGKAPAQGNSQDKRLLAGQPFVMHEGASFGVKSSRSTSLQEFMHEGVSSGVKSNRSTSLQEFVPAKVTPMTKVAPTTVRREHNNKVSKF